MSDFDVGLATLDAQSLRRQRRIVDSPCAPELIVEGRRVLAFCSNDYLGLANDPTLIAAAQEGARLYGVGSGASPLINGHMTPHSALEHRLAEFTRMERALLFSTGYMANLGIVPVIVERGDAIFCDRLNHASLVDAARLSRADLNVYPHLDLAALETRLVASQGRRKLVITDSVFSMDGDLAPLSDLLALAVRHDAWLMVDDAHGFGLLGPQGRGALAHFGLTSPRLLHMGTLGKAAGAAGAFVAGTATAIEWILQKARTYIFSTAEPPMLAHTLLKSIDLIENGDQRRRHLAGLIALFRSSVRLKRWRLIPSDTAIQPLLIGGNVETMEVTSQLFAQGFWVPGIRPPTVPPGTARLRITLSSAHSEEHVVGLAMALNELERLTAGIDGPSELGAIRL
ncbi:MAG: 8-amino-7-oxononanoate synthase [Rhodocyclaceae bacterium]|nr:MAG: 8-amino-7-oxononanoate synthase [Rhodocyclaceae bacterium]